MCRAEVVDGKDLFADLIQRTCTYNKVKLVVEVVLRACWKFKELLQRQEVEHVQNEVNIPTQDEVSLVADLLWCQATRRKREICLIKANTKLCWPLKTKLQLNGHCWWLMAVSAVASSV